MIIAGFGLRESATLASLQGALSAAGIDVQGLAVVADKAALPAITALTATSGLPLYTVEIADLARAEAQTPSPRQPARYGAKSVAEAAALAAAGPGAKLILPKTTSPDGKATLAIAEGTGK